MRTTIPLPDDLHEDVRRILEPYLRDVTGLYGARLEGIILYGSAARGEYLPGRSNINLLFFLAANDLTALKDYGKIHRRWAKEHIVVPLFFSWGDIPAAQPSFVLEYFDIKHRHVVLLGRDPFAELDIDLGALERECRKQIQSHPVRLRQRLVEGLAKVEAQAMLLPLSLTALLPCLRGWLHARGLPVPRTIDLLLQATQSALGIDVEPLREVWQLKQGHITPGPLETPRLFERYLFTVQALAGKVGA